MKKINVKEIKRVLKHIKSDIRRLEMSVWGFKKDSAEAEILTPDVADKKYWPACSTKACFAGWAVLMNTPKTKWKSLFNKDGGMKQGISGKAEKILGLTEEEAEIIFRGPSTYLEGGKEQFKQLRRDINQVFVQRDLKDRV